MPETWDVRRFEQAPITVVLHKGLLADADNRAWMNAVAKEERNRRTVFVEHDAEPWIHVRADGEENLPAPGDLAAASAVLAERGLARAGSEFHSIALTNELPHPLDGAATSGKVYSPAGLEEGLKELNRGYFEDLVEQLRSPLGVMPFVGAGMSARFELPLWQPFLHKAASNFGMLDEIQPLLDKGDYETVAEKLNEHDPTRFTHLIDHTFRLEVNRAELRTGALSYLPLLTDGPVMTTNFDQVLENAFEEGGSPLRPIEGPNEWRTVEAVHRNLRALLKIHGSHDDPTFRVFTKSEFDKGYEGGIASLAWLTFTNRPLLFLGCSLTESDRTVKVLAQIHDRLPGLKHYAVLPANYFVERQRERENELSTWGVSPVWYPPGQHERVDEIVRDLVERAAVRERPVPARARGPLIGRHDESALRAVDVPPAAPRPETAVIAEAVRRGEVAFFLGAYAHLGLLPLGNEFYADLATRFRCPELTGDRSAVAAFVASRKGTGALWEAIKEALSVPISPSMVYRVLSALPAFLRARGQRAPIWILTTNYDKVLERALTEAREPFHLLYYMQEEGLFAHTAPDGSVRIITRPEAIRRVDPPGTVVVKLNGGMVEAKPPAESVVIASGQFERLAGQLPDALPQCLRAALTERSLLFLGHGLQAPDVKQMIKDFAAGGSTPHSWAVQLPPGATAEYETWREEVEYREGLGLKTIECDLEDFVAGLTAELLA